MTKNQHKPAATKSQKAPSLIEAVTCYSGASSPLQKLILVTFAAMISHSKSGCWMPISAAYMARFCCAPVHKVREELELMSYSYLDRVQDNLGKPYRYTFRQDFLEHLWMRQVESAKEVDNG